MTDITSPSIPGPIIPDTQSPQSSTPPHFHKDFRIEAKDLIPNGDYVSVVPTWAAPEGTEVQYLNGSDFRIYRMLDGTWRLVNPSAMFTYYDKKSWSDESSTKTFSGLSAHDEWRLIMNLHNERTTQRPDIRVLLNGITSGYAGEYSDNVSHYFDYSAGAGYAGWIVTSMVSDNYQNVIARVDITGKHHNGEKGCSMKVSRSGINSVLLGQTGFLSGDSNDVSSIGITAAGTGTVELWYRDNHA